MSAKLVVTGIAKLAEELAKMSENAGAVAKQMLFAGAEEMKTAWQESIERKGLTDTWAMHDSIGFKPETESYGGAAAITVKPQGKDDSGTSNAEKAWVLEYGVPSKNIPAQHHIADAKSMAEPKVLSAMQNVFDAYLQTGAIPSVSLSKNNAGGKPSKSHR